MAATVVMPLGRGAGLCKPIEPFFAFWHHLMNTMKCGGDYPVTVITVAFCYAFVHVLCCSDICQCLRLLTLD